MLIFSDTKTLVFILKEKQLQCEEISHHFKQHDRDPSTQSKEDGHNDHDGSHCFIGPYDGNGSNPAAGVQKHWVLGDLTNSIHHSEQAAGSQKEK